MAILDLHPSYRNVRYTLRRIDRSEGSALEYAARLRTEGLEVYVFHEVGPSGRPLFFVAARHLVDPLPRAGYPQEYSADWVATRFAIETFRDVVRRWRTKGQPTRWYKRLDVEGLRRSILRYRFSGSVLDVTSNIVSSTIISHPFPNANHRTTLAIARQYLQDVGITWPQYTLRGRGHQRFYRDCFNWARESKFLLQLLRHGPLVRVAHEEGYTALLLGESTIRQISPGDLMLAREELAARHLAISRKLIRELGSEHARVQLEQPNRLGLRAWMVRYRPPPNRGSRRKDRRSPG